MDSVTLEDKSFSFLFIDMIYGSKLEDKVSSSCRLGFATTISSDFIGM